LIPLDTDEFMYFPNEDPLDLHDMSLKIREHLLSVPQDVSILRYSSFLGSIPDPTSQDYSDYRHQRPAKSITKFYNQGWDKLIVRGSTFLEISQGNHHARVSSGRTQTSDLIGLLHLHETGQGRKRERCRMSMLGYRQVQLDFFSMSPLDQLKICNDVIATNGFGGHRVQQYKEFIVKELICREFVDTLGRLPSLEELKKFEKNPSNSTHILATCPISKMDLQSIGDLIYEESHDAKRVLKIHQLSKLLP
jgi:hypothetical protein